MFESSYKRWRLFISVALISMTMLMFEIILSRLFSTILSYHYVFLVVSMAVLGLGLGSVIEYNDQTIDNDDRKISNNILGLVISKFMVFGLIYFMPYISHIVYIVLSIIPFIFLGKLMAFIFTRYSQHIRKIYFADMVGGGLAAILSILFLNQFKFVRTSLIIFIINTIILLIWSVDKKINYISLGTIMLLSVSMFSNITAFIENNFIGYMTSPTTSLQRVRSRGGNPEIIYTNWDGFARTDVIRLNDTDDSWRIVTINGGANAGMVRWDGQPEEIIGITDEVDFLPYIIRENEDVAIIGAGGGKDVLQAVLGGAFNIDAIEINPSAIEAVKDMSDYNGNLYNLPQVNFIEGDGRSVIQKSGKKYDVVFLSLVMTNTTESIGLSMAESYIYTEEAIATYIEHLKEDGQLVFVTHSENELIKVSNTVYRVLQEKGIPVEDIGDHFIVATEVANHGNGVTVSYPMAMIKNSKYTQEEIAIAEQFISKHGYGMIHLPGIYEESMYGDLSQGLVDIDSIIKTYPSNIAPATDNQPFFYNFSKGITPNFIYMILIIVIALLMIFKNVVIANRATNPSILFGMLGLGFMIIEIGFIQKLTLFLEHPTRAFVITLSSLLVSAGIGSYCSAFKIFIDKKNRHYSIIGVVFSLFFTLIFFNNMHLFLGLNIYYKTFISVTIIFFSGYFMGMVLPHSIRVLNESKRNQIIPLMYGINGITSVLGSVIAVVISMYLGINMTMISGIIIYALILLMMPKLLAEGN
ncbi:spermine/spermidine synthase [Natranaerovirga pectinivora]|uniref:Spermine/spermidine synthase n=1 Tax=Natranaerovirga pectinivora TaxID=682400 RepID=A0A4R3MLJ2_9FIRM|nr:class I SAM-dependent methyltransferase [Natranaerovirga pectinivora]TCT15566.1 spermine/spermidine synthase [Natranaerovirga pectinivora]